MQLTTPRRADAAATQLEERDGIFVSPGVNGHLGFYMDDEKVAESVCRAMPGQSWLFHLGPMTTDLSKWFRAMVEQQRERAAVLGHQREFTF